MKKKLRRAWRSRWARSSMFIAGLVTGLGLLSWMILGPMLWGHAPWSLVDHTALFERFEWRAAPSPVPGGAGLFWTLFALGGVGSFVGGWWWLRRERALLEMDRRALEREIEQRQADEAERAAWDAFEAAEAEDLGAEEQCARLERYLEASARVQLASSVLAERVRRCRELAAELKSTSPEVALRVLELAESLHDAGAAREASLGRIVAADAARFISAVVLVLACGLSGGVLILGTIGAVMSFAKILLIGLAIIIVLGILLVVVAG